MSRLRGIMKGTGVGNDIALTVMMQGIGAAVAYAIMVVITRTLAPDLFDQYALAQVYVTAGAAVLDLGIVAVTYPRVAVADPVTSPAFSASLRLRLLTVPLGLLVVVVMAVTGGHPELLWPAVVGLGLAMVSTKFTSIRQVNEMVWRIEGRTWLLGAFGVFDALLFLGLFLLLRQSVDFGPVEVFGLLLLTNIPGFLVVSIPVLRRWRRAGGRLWGGRRSYTSSIVIGALPIAVMGIAGQLFARIEPLVINSTIGLSSVGDYIAAVQPLIGTIFIPVTVSVGLLPLAAQIHMRRRSDLAMEQLVSVGVRLLIGLALLIGVLAAVFAEPILSLFGPAYVDDAWILQVYTISNLLEYLVVFFDQHFIAVSKRREVMIGTLMSLALALGFQLALVPVMGLAGILLGKILALLCKILYQFVRSLPETRRGTLRAFARTVPLLILTPGGYFLSEPLPLLWRGLLLGAGTLGLLFLLRIIDIRELDRIRRLRLT